MSTSNKVLELLQCPECGAACESSLAKCWLCGATLNPFRDRPDVRVTVAKPKEEPWRHVLDGVFGVAFVATLITVALIAVGVAHDEPTALIPFVVFFGPPLIAVAVREGRVRARGETPTWGGRLITLLISVAATIGIAAVLIVAAIIGLILYCFSMLAGGH